MHKSNTVHCGQILSADQIYEHSGKWKNYGIDKLNFSFRLGEKGFSIPTSYTPDSWTEQLTAVGGAAGGGEHPKRKLFKNTPHYQATIQKFGYGHQEGVDTILNVQMNPSKILHPYNLITDRYAIADMMKGLQNDFEKDKIEVDFEKARVTRIDIANNMKLDEPLINYQRVFDTFSGKRAMRKTHDTTRYWDNGQSQFIIYDKNKELEDVIVKELMPEHPIIRAEMKLKKMRSVETVMKDVFLGNLISDDMEYVTTFNEYVRSRIFKSNQIIQSQIDFGEIYKMYEELFKTYGNRAWDILIKSLGIIKLAELKGIDTIIDVVSQFHNDRYVRRKKAELNRLLNVFYPEHSEKTPEFLKRYNEIKDKMIIKIAA